MDYQADNWADNRADNRANNRGDNRADNWADNQMQKKWCTFIKSCVFFKKEAKENNARIFNAWL